MRPRARARRERRLLLRAQEAARMLTACCPDELGTGTRVSPSRLRRMELTWDLSSASLRNSEDFLGEPPLRWVMTVVQEPLWEAAPFRERSTRGLLAGLRAQGSGSRGK